MRSVSLRLVDLERKPLIPLGFEGENEYMTINFDCKTVFDKHPAAVPTLAVTPPQGDSYPAVVVRDGDIISWTVCDSDLVYPGEGVLQLTFVDGTIIGKTYKARTKVLDSITPSGEAPTPIQNWLIQAAAALQALPTEVVSSVAALMGAMVGIGETLDPDENVTVSYDAENNTLTIGVPKGKDADPTELIDDTSTAQNRTWSAEKLNEEIGGKADKANPEFTGSINLGRQDSSDVGANSTALGTGIIAKGDNEAVVGMYNADDTITEWKSGTNYVAGSIAAIENPKLRPRPANPKYDVYVCIEPNSDETFDSSKWEFVAKISNAPGKSLHRFAVGTGSSDQSRQNGFSVRRDGKGYFKGDVFVNCNENGTGGTRVAKVTDIIDPTSIIDDNAGDGDTEKTWSADKLESETSALLTEINSAEDGLATINNKIDDVYHSIPGESDASTVHENVQNVNGLTFIGNGSAFSTAKYANAKNVAPSMTYNGTKYGVGITGSNRFVEFNGTANATETFLISYIDFTPHLPAGDYKLVAYVDPGESNILANNQFVFTVYYDVGSKGQNVWINSGDETATVTATDTIRRIAITGGVTNGSVYSNYKLWFGVFPASAIITDTNHTVEDEAEYPIEISGNYDAIDSMMHQSVVSTFANIKEYIDALDVDINDKLTYVTPEKYGAKGDGVTDDYLALQSCITYGIQNGMPVRAFGYYYVSQGIVIECDDQDIYINKIKSATQNSEAVVKLTGYRNRITINSIYAFDGNCDGFLLYGKTAHWSEFNTIHIPYIVAYKNAVSVKVDNDAYACTNTFYTQYLHSATMNCIYESYGFGENVFYGGGQIVCPNGWAIYLDHSGNNHFYNFALENRAKSGIYIDNSISNEFKGFRIAELRGQKTASSVDTGTLIKFIGTSAFNLFECADIINQVDIDVSQATTNTELSTYTGSLEVASNAINIVRGTGVRGHGWLDGDNTAYVTTYGKEIITLRNHRIVTPIGKLSYAVDADLDYTIFFAPVQATEFVMKQDATIKFNDSYCCIGFNEIIVDQTDGNAMIYDKNNQLIFDGQTEGTGVYRLTCVCDPDNNVWNTLKPTSNIKATLYDGENNIWKVERVTYI